VVVDAPFGGDAGTALMAAARTSFVKAMGWTSLIGVGFAIAGAIVALVLLPDRSSDPAPLPDSRPIHAEVEAMA